MNANRKNSALFREAVGLRHVLVLPLDQAENRRREKAVRGRLALRKHFLQNISVIRANSCDSWARKS